MKVKIEFEENETIEEVEERLEKALKQKRMTREQYLDVERYSEQFVEDFHDSFVKRHNELVKDVLRNIKAEIEKDLKR